MKSWSVLVCIVIYQSAFSHVVDLKKDHKVISRLNIPSSTFFFKYIYTVPKKKVYKSLQCLTRNPVSYPFFVTTQVMPRASLQSIIFNKTTRNELELF